MVFNVAFFQKLFIETLKSVPVTLFIVFLSLLLAAVIGFWLAVVRNKNRRVSSNVISLYISFIRGTPLIVQIYIIYYSVPGILAAAFPQMDVYGINPVWYAVIVFTINTSAILCEVFRSALGTVGAGQMEAAVTNSLTEFQAYRDIIIPQMAEAACPNLCNATLDLMKNSSLVFYMTVMDIMGTIKTEAAVGYNYLEGYSLAWLMYLVLCVGIEWIYKSVEHHLKRHKLARV